MRIQKSRKVVADLRLRTKLLNVQLRTCGCGLRKLKFGCGFADCGLEKKLAVPSTVLKHLPEPAQLLLLSLFNMSWHSHTFPSCWKPTTIIPIHTPGKPTFSPSFFRPISLTSCISKFFERLILSRLTFHLESNHLLSTCQAGFRPGRSPLDQILSQSIWDGFQRKQPPDRTILASVDFSKAFDSVWHCALFHKLLSLKLHLASFFGCAPSFLIVELKSRLVVPTAALSASDVGSPRAQYLVGSSSFCLLMTSLRIYFGVPMPPCMLTIWPSGPPPQTRSKPPLLSNPPSLRNMVQLMETSTQSKEV